MYFVFPKGDKLKLCEHFNGFLGLWNRQTTPYKDWPINPRLIPFRIFLFLSQKIIGVISRNNPILDFTKEMHP